MKGRQYTTFVSGTVLTTMSTKGAKQIFNNQLFERTHSFNINRLLQTGIYTE